MGIVISQGYHEKGEFLSKPYVPEWMRVHMLSPYGLLTRADVGLTSKSIFYELSKWTTKPKRSRKK